MLPPRSSEPVSSAAARMSRTSRSGIHSVNEPAALPDRRGQAEGLLLAINKGLEVVQDDRLIDNINVFKCQCLEQKRVAAKPG